MKPSLCERCKHHLQKTYAPLFNLGKVDFCENPQNAFPDAHFPPEMRMMIYAEKITEYCPGFEAKEAAKP